MAIKIFIFSDRLTENRTAGQLFEGTTTVYRLPSSFSLGSAGILFTSFQPPPPTNLRRRFSNETHLFLLEINPTLSVYVMSVMSVMPSVMSHELITRNWSRDGYRPFYEFSSRNVQIFIVSDTRTVPASCQTRVFRGQMEELLSRSTAVRGLSLRSDRPVYIPTVIVIVIFGHERFSTSITLPPSVKTHGTVHGQVL